MNVVPIDPAQVQQIIALLTEIRDRLPASKPESTWKPPPSAAEILDGVPAPRLFGWAIDGSEGPPREDQAAAAAAAERYLKDHPTPRSVAEIEAVRALLRAARIAGINAYAP